MLMCFKYQNIYNYYRQATSILDINALEYYGDKYMDAWFRDVKDIIFTAMTAMFAKLMTKSVGKTTYDFSATRSTTS